MSRGNNSQLSPELRAGLDLARACAAIYVVLYHVAQHNVRGLASLPLRFGQEAVIVFFLLSGFVIFANERDRVATGLPAYLLRRVRRIYPALVLAVMLSMVLWLLDPGYAGRLRVGDLVATLLSVQDVSALKPGVIADPVLNDNPLWSLSYEMAFYLVFPLVMVLWRRYERGVIHVVGAVAVVGFLTYLAAPNHWSLMAAYFLLWWVGAHLANAYLGNRFTARALWPAALWTSALVAASLVAVVVDGWHGVGYYPGLMTRHFVFVLLCLVLTLTPAMRWGGSLALRWAPPVAFVASLSYGLYVFHYPLLLNWSWAHTPVGFVTAVLVLVALSYFGDRVLDRRLPRPKPTRAHQASGARAG